jgi:hypothetical protein
LIKGLTKRATIFGEAVGGVAALAHQRTDAAQKLLTQLKKK